MYARIRELIAFNPSRKRLDTFIAEAARSVPPKALVLDAGAGDGRYRHHFKHATLHATDFLQVAKPYDLARIEFVSNLVALPSAADIYDLVLCTQVLEHLPDPRSAIAGIARSLKPGGALWLSAPLFYEEHEAPFDYFRYTQYALRRMVEEQGMVVERIEWLEGYYATLGYQLKEAARSLKPLPQNVPGSLWLSLLLTMLRPFFAVLALFFAQLEMRHKQTDAGYNKNYVLVARKPAIPA